MLRRFLRPAETWLAVIAPRARSPMRKITVPQSSVSTGVSTVSCGRRHLVGKGLDRAARLLARPVKRLEVGAQRRNPQAGHVLGHIEPVGPDIGHAARRASVLRRDPPVPVRLVEQPVLRIGALHHENLAQLAGSREAGASAAPSGSSADCGRRSYARSLRAASAASSCASWTLIASGFSQSTCFPASSAAFAMG